MDQAGKVDLGKSSFSTLNTLANVKPQGPLAYTTYDFLKHFSGAIAILKFVAHVASLPLAVFLRRGFGMRYVDDVHIALAFILWQFLGVFSTLAGLDSLAGVATGVLINLLGYLFVPAALYHRFKAKQRALRREGYSYYPGLPWGFWAHLPSFAVGRLSRSADWLLGRLSRSDSRLRVPRFLTDPTFVIAEERIQGLVRRFGEPLLVVFLGLLVSATGGNHLFAIFLIWTAAMLSTTEALTQRETWELYLDQLDAETVAKEQQRMLSGGPQGVSLTNGVFIAEVASPKDVLHRYVKSDTTSGQNSEPTSEPTS
jgi:hypothetical protein